MSRDGGRENGKIMCKKAKILLDMMIIMCYYEGEGGRMGRETNSKGAGQWKQKHGMNVGIHTATQ
jgi:hypothetical protein